MWWLRASVPAVLAIAACAPRVAAPPPEATYDPAAVYAAVRRQEAAVHTLRARFTVQTRRGGEVRRADGVLLVKKPDRFRVRLLSAFGLTVFDYTSQAAHARMVLPLEGKEFTDGEIADHSPFSPADMRQVFLRSDGFPPQCSAQAAAAETVVDCRDAEGVVSRLIRVDTTTHRVRQDISFAAGQPHLVILFDEYRRVDAVELPFLIDLRYPDTDVRLRIAVRSYEVNPDLPDSLFDPPQQGGAGS
jgi:hypothetical protein